MDDGVEGGGGRRAAIRESSALTLVERIEAAIGAALMRLPARIQYKLSGSPPVRIAGQVLHPQFQLLLALRRRRSSFGLCEPTPVAARARLRHEARLFTGRRTKVAAVRDFAVRGPAGPIPVRHYVPFERGPRPLILYFHGGGYVIGDIESYDGPCRILCRHSGMHLLSVEYRLAPEHPFPAALEDGAAVLQWAQGSAKSLGAERVAVGGDNAGATLATVIARESRRAGAAPLAQLLIYPPTDSLTPRPSRALFGDGFILTMRDFDQFAACYTGGTAFTGSDARVSPLRAADLSGLPPALVVTAAFDMLRDEGEAYAAALEQAGTRARVVRLPGLGHGFVNAIGISPAARDALIGVARDFRALVDGLPR